MKNQCFLVQDKSDITVLYIHVPGDGKFLAMTKRFVETYQRFPPGIAHRMVVISQTREPYPDVIEMLQGLGDYEIFLHDNSGKDIGGFMHYASICTSPMLVCLSGTTYLRRPGWLRRMYDVFAIYKGRGLFGACGNNGDTGVNAYPHIRTSSFWCEPNLLNTYPERITDDRQRYPFEHGPSNFTLWVQKQGLPTVAVDFTSALEYGNWGRNPRAFRRGDQFDLLVGDRNTEPPDYPYP